VTDWYSQQKKFQAGADYFENVFNVENKRSPQLAKYALLEKAQLLHAARRRDEAVQTVARLKAVPGGDALLLKKIARLEEMVRK
jgi:hypothetical protein